MIAFGCFNSIARAVSLATSSRVCPTHWPNGELIIACILSVFVTSLLWNWYKIIVPCHHRLILSFEVDVTAVRFSHWRTTDAWGLARVLDPQAAQWANVITQVLRPLCRQITPPYTSIYVHIISYTSIYLHIPPYTHIYPHIPPYTPYTSIYPIYHRIRSYTSIYQHIPPNTFIYYHILSFTSKHPILGIWGPTRGANMVINVFDTMAVSISPKGLVHPKGIGNH